MHSFRIWLASELVVQMRRVHFSNTTQRVINTWVNFKGTDLLSASDKPVWSKQCFHLRSYLHKQAQRETLVKKCQMEVSEKAESLGPFVQHWRVFTDVFVICVNKAGIPCACMFCKTSLWCLWVICFYLQVLIPVLPCLYHQAWKKTFVLKHCFFYVCVCYYHPG